MYRSLRRAGYSKEAAARISNAATPGHQVKEFDESKVDRSEGGQFSSGSGGGGGEKPKSKPKRAPKKPKQTPEARQAAQQAEAAAKREAVGNELNAADNEQMSKAGLDSLNAIRSGAPDRNADDLISKGLAVRGRDGRVRLTGDGKKILSAADKGDTQGVLDAVSAAGDAQASRQERAAAREAKRAEREAKRAEREAARAAKKPPKGEGAPAPAKPTKGGGGGTRQPAPIVGGRSLFELGKAMRPKRRRLRRAAYAEAKAAGFPPDQARAQARLALRRDDADRARRGYERAVGRLTVVKDAQGRDRWASISSTAYRDRDGEIVSTQALGQAVASADAAGRTDRGPLRFWHVPGLDLGDCDFQATTADGRVLIESGTFRQPAYARAVKATADRYAMSIGFTHPATEPDPAGVFRTIQIFERSLVPAGRASNPFTRITTKETTMRPEQLAALKALLGEQGAANLLAAVETTDKAAQAAGVAYKESEALQTVYTLPDGTPGVIENGTFTRLKAVTEKAPMPPAQMMQAAMTEAADAAGAVAGQAAAEELEEAAEPIGDDTDVMDLTVGDLKVVLGGIVEEMIAGYNAKMGEMKSQYEAMGKAFGAMQAQKDTAVSEQTAALATVQQTLADVGARLKELEGDQPATKGYRPSTDPATVIPPAVAGLTTALKGASTPEQDAYALIFGTTA